MARTRTRGRPHRLTTALVAGLAPTLILSACAADDDVDETAGDTTAETAMPTTGVASPTAVTEGRAPDGCVVEEVVSGLDQRHKVAQLMTVGVASEEDAVNAVGDQGVGGVFVGSDVIGPLLGADRIPDIVAQSPLPVSVAIDQEGGRVDRLNAIREPVPAPRTMAETMSPDEVRGVAADTGSTLRDLGVTIDFAPSIDVSDQPADDVIGDRSFSRDAGVVIDYGRAFADGLRSEGVTPVYKHFPGHGHSSGDSHLGAVTTPPLDQTADLEPFRALVGEPESAVMVGHMSVPGLTEPGVPATLSAPVYDALRSGELGTQPFDGVIFTDDLSGMMAISDFYDLPTAVLESLKAGVDSPLFISTAELPRVIDTVDAAVDTGEYPAERLDDSLRRVLAMRGCT